MVVSFLLCIYSEQHFVARPHAEHSQKAVQRRLHPGIRAGGTVEANARTLDLGAALHLQRARGGEELEGMAGPSARYAQRLAADGLVFLELGFGMAPVDLFFAAQSRTAK